MLTTLKWSSVIALSLFVAGGLMGCKKSADSQTSELQEQKEVALTEKLPEPVMDPANEEVIRTKLALADLADGTSDKVIHKCPVCMLRMNGSEKFAVDYAGYSVHLCSEYCKETFEEDPKAAILALKVDE
jgi:YHS domain-containing protein